MAPTLEVAGIFRRHGEAFRQAHAGHLGYVERRIMGAITACRTAARSWRSRKLADVAALSTALAPLSPARAQIAHRFMSSVGYPDWRQFPCTMQLRQHQCVTPIGLDPVARCRGWAADHSANMGSRPCG